MDYQTQKTSIAASPCPISSVLDIIAAKWTVEILREVSIAPTRTRKFLRVIPGLSMKSLQSRLKELEKYGLIERIEYDVLPRRVEHVLSERGKKVLGIYVQLKALSEEIFPVCCVCPIELKEQGVCAPFDCPHRPNGRD
jgi:DNA-binding HxlR family transcriptional regulator